MEIDPQIQRRDTAPRLEEFETVAEWGQAMSLWVKSRERGPAPKRVVTETVFVERPPSEQLKALLLPDETVAEGRARLYSRLEYLNAEVHDNSASRDEIKEHEELTKLQFELRKEPGDGEE